MCAIKGKLSFSHWKLIEILHYTAKYIFTFFLFLQIFNNLNNIYIFHLKID